MKSLLFIWRAGTRTARTPIELYMTSWWRHQMETFSVLLALCAGNSPVPGKFPAHRPVTRSFDIFFDLRLNKRLSKQSWGWWFEMPPWSLWRHCNVTTNSDTSGTAWAPLLFFPLWRSLWKRPHALIRISIPTSMKRRHGYHSPKFNADASVTLHDANYVILMNTCIWIF